MLFNLFGNKNKSATVTDKIWLHLHNKKEGLLALLSQFPEAIVIGWFQDTIATYESFLQEKAPGTIVQDARQVPTPLVKGKILLLLEHHPLLNKEQAAFERWQAGALYILSSLEDPLLLHTGSQNLISTMEKMGMKENESLEHPLISKAIRNAQLQLEKKVIAEHSCSSSEEWFRINLPG